jgi:hypothetical protein
VSLLYLVLVLVLVGVLLHCLNAYGSEYIDGKFIRLINVVVIIAAIVYVLAAFGDLSLSLMQLAPGDDVQSSTTTVLGIEAQPVGIDGSTLRLGYIRSQRSRVPGFDEPTQIPSVRIETKVDGHGSVIGETLEVDDNAPSKGWFSK